MLNEQKFWECYKHVKKTPIIQVKHIKERTNVEPFDLLYLDLDITKNRLAQSLNILEKHAKLIIYYSTTTADFAEDIHKVLCAMIAEIICAKDIE